MVLLVFACAAANAQSARIVKVLPHFLDLKGRNAANPSLFDRDAYQQELRGSPTNRSALRFDVQWKAHGYDTLKLRLEAKGLKGKQSTAMNLEQPIRSGFFSKWSGLTLGGEDYKNFGELISWRATLMDGTNVVAEHKSFLW